MYTENPLPTAETDNIISNIVSLKLYGRDSAGETKEINAWNTPVIKISLPKVLNTSTLTTSDGKPATNTAFVCKYWDRVYLIWKTDGCILKSVSTNLFNCECTHTTEFSV